MKHWIALCQSMLGAVPVRRECVMAGMVAALCAVATASLLMTAWTIVTHL